MVINRIPGPMQFVLGGIVDNPVRRGIDGSRTQSIAETINSEGSQL